MMIVTVELTSETEQQLRLKAGRRGQSLETYLRQLAEREASGDAEAPDMLSLGLEWLTRRGTEEVRAARERILGAAPVPRDVPADKSAVDVVEGNGREPRRTPKSEMLSIGYRSVTLPPL